jgi:parvulin-like peptidyl-prolyl isomerase
MQRQVQLSEQRARAAEEDNGKLLTAIEKVQTAQRVAQSTAVRSTTERTKTAPADDAAKTAEPRVHIRLIQLKRAADDTDASLLAQANQILARFQRGESFAELAREFSVDVKRAKGGDWGWQSRSDFKPRFADAAFSLKKGQATQPIILPEGCFIIFAEDRVDPRGDGQ